MSNADSRANVQEALEKMGQVIDHLTKAAYLSNDAEAAVASVTGAESISFFLSGFAFTKSEIGRATTQAGYCIQRLEELLRVYGS